MRVSSRVAALAVALSVVAAACSSSTTPSPVATQNVTAPPTAAATPAPTPEPTATPTATPTAAPTDTPTPAPTATAKVTPKPPTPAPIVHGQYILYTLAVSLPNDVSQPQLWLVKPDGTGAKKIADGQKVGPLSPPRHNLDGQWSHNGAVVHITSYPSCVPHLSDLPINGGAAAAKATLTNHDAGLVWSPADTQLMFWHFVGAQDTICEQDNIDPTVNLMNMKANGTGKKTIKANFLYTVTAWLPDGTSLLAFNPVTYAWFKVNPANGAATPLGIMSSRVTVSPDGTRIAYLSGGHLWVRALSGGAAKDFGAATDFAWRPNGGSLAVSSGQLRVFNSVTGIGVVVYPFGTSSPTWSPDGGKIAFVKAGGGIYVVAATGGSVSLLPNTHFATNPQWQP